MPLLLLPRLYAILDIDAVFARGLQPLSVLDAWLHAGVRLVQLRAKALTLGPMLELADSVGARCRAAGALFVVNDRADVAELCGADGVHLGQTDLSPAQAVAVCPRVRLIGLSTHSASQLVAGLGTAATYLAIGPVFATGTKANPDPEVGIEGVQFAAALVGESAVPRPLVAIGGIGADQAAAVIAAGADSIAVASALLGDDPARQARTLLRTLT